MDTLIFNKVGNYINALVAFIVLQGLAYAFYFGSNTVFNCAVHVSKYLAETLSALFLLVALLGVYGVRALGRIEATLAPEYAGILRRLTRGKIVVVLLFGLFPALLTFCYGVLGAVPAFCSSLVS
ncbi:hypothetical protein [Pseudomaricurvus sp. HS19]|uniref:hypothetical protein n=1 Tax=Pseudomaricurvus sp. HS19 TaxID=2692626 RepID=UPI0013688918|nr:hypothetical protein [Pseudomaricurvus sp. HS19]MYM63685.1 hypothetical protein [Pseudomaricurvus sp. HS19]